MLDKLDSQSKLDSAVSYSLYEELKKILHIHRKERIHACASQSGEFQFVFSCFHNYEVSILLACIVLICLCHLPVYL